MAGLLRTIRRVWHRRDFSLADRSLPVTRALQRRLTGRAIREALAAAQ